MPQSLAMNLIHLIYSTKERRPWLSPEIRPALFAYQAGAFKELDCPALIIGGERDHVHAMFVLSKNVALAKVLEEVKSASSKWIKTQDKGAHGFSLARRIRGILRGSIPSPTRSPIH